MKGKVALFNLYIFIFVVLSVICEARYYNPQTGGFLTRDPSSVSGGINLYNGYFAQRDAIDPMGLKDYKLGNYDLRIKHDNGSGTHGATAPPTLKQSLAKTGWHSVALAARAIGLEDAGRHMLMYLENTGNDQTIIYARLISDVPSAQKVRDSEINEAMVFAETINKKKFNISSYAASLGYARKDESWNWYYAVGGYSTWGKAKVTKDGDCYKMKMKLKFEDKYNWDAGKAVTIFGVTVPDVSLGELHRAGIAWEYILIGDAEYTIKWSKGERVGSGAKVEIGGRE